MTLHKAKFLYPLICLVGLTSIVTSCKQTKEAVSSYDYGTKADSARYYFFKGWEEILDNGRWRKSEIAFRKAIEIDPDWLLGQSLVGRITRDGEERQAILSFIETNMAKVDDSERLLLDLQIASLKAANMRDRGISISPVDRENRMRLAEENLSEFIRSHPEDTYFKAEYIEFLHANHGAQTALDSLVRLTTLIQKNQPFFINYKAMMELELGYIEKAKQGLEQLDELLVDASNTSPDMLRAQILMQEDSLLQAQEVVDHILNLEPDHMIARGLSEQIRSRIHAVN